MALFSTFPPFVCRNSGDNRIAGDQLHMRTLVLILLVVQFLQLKLSKIQRISRCRDKVFNRQTDRRKPILNDIFSQNTASEMSRETSEENFRMWKAFLFSLLFYSFACFNRRNQPQKLSFVSLDLFYRSHLSNLQTFRDINTPTTVIKQGQGGRGTIQRHTHS